MIKIKSRESNLVVQDLNKEVMIYDLTQNKALCLNETASIIWRLCDWKKSAAEISQIMSRKLKSPISEDFVWLALDQLKKENLLQNADSIKPTFNGLSRREVIKKVGLASMLALPLISSIVAPSAIHAQSGACVPTGQDFCIAPQVGIQDCVDAIVPAAVTGCCIGMLTIIVFDNPIGSNSCCGTCGNPIG
jgi:hypothetical protein